MAYTAPSSNAVNFTVAGSAYTPPSNTAVDFTTYVLGVVSGVGAGSYSPLCSSSGGVGVAGSGATNYAAQALSYGNALVTGQAAATYRPRISGVGSYTNSAIGAVTYTPAASSTGTIGPPSYFGVGSARYAPVANAWETPPTAVGAARYGAFSAASAMHGVTGTGAGVYGVRASASGAHGRSGVGLASYGVRANSVCVHGVAGDGASTFRAILVGFGTARILVAGAVNIGYTPAIVGSGRFGYQGIAPDFMHVTVRRQQVAYVIQ